jgi:DNA polymerase III psi subunit
MLNKNAEYQNALLDVMGIQRWELRGDERSEEVSEAEQDDSPTLSATPLSVPSLSAITISDQDALFVQDVTQYAAQSPYSSNLSDANIQWYVSDNIAFDGQCIYLPSIAKVKDSAQLKKALFDAITNYSVD